MADLVDPEKLVSVAQVAKEYGYHPKYFSKLAAEGKIRAWRIGNTWASTRQLIDTYVRSAPPAGRPVEGKKSQPKHRNFTKKS